MIHVPESIPESQSSQQMEPTQVSQPYYSQTQQASQLSSQLEARQKFWAIFIPENSQHSILKLPWNRPCLQIGRSPLRDLGNNLVLHEKRISNRHCRITLGLQLDGTNGVSSSSQIFSPESESEPQVWIEDLKSSNGTFVNGVRLSPRKLLQDGDEISLGHIGTAENHDVRYIFRSVGAKGAKSNGAQKVGQVYERYQLLSSLGKGTFAEVKKAVDVETGDMRAIKQIVKHRFQHDPKTLNLFQREIDICKTLTHENICRLIEWYEDPQHICLVLEYIDGGDLLDFITKWPDNPMPENEAADLSWQICRAVAYCHEMGVTHRDLKPENILLTSETAEHPRQVKIADFGLSKMVHTETMLTSMVGTPQYLAPEVVMQTQAKPGYENVVDCWSVGIIVYSMMTKALPFDEDTNMPIEARIRKRFTQPFDVATLHGYNVSETAIEFISRLLEKDPSQRMTMAEALRHPWLAGPSSQEEETPPQPTLGGDSMWNIQAFEHDYDYPIEDGEPDEGMATDEGCWSRPMTASATNLGAGSEGHRIDSDDSFSQPLQNLHLVSRIGGGVSSVNKMSGLSEEIIATPHPEVMEEKEEEEEEEEEEQLIFPPPPPRFEEGMNTVQATGQPTIPTAAQSPIDVPITGTNGTIGDTGKATIITNVGTVSTRDPTNGSTPISAKRKHDQTEGFSKIFSSGSLTPPPPEKASVSQLEKGNTTDSEVRIELNGEARHGEDKSRNPTATRRSKRSTVVTSNQTAQIDGGAAKRTARESIAMNGGGGGENGKEKGNEAVRSSPRRPRKSIRLM